MWKEDNASRGLGMEIVKIGAGHAVLAMTVKPEMVNGHGIAHGGFIFTLADSAFAFACNSYNERTVAAHGNISFIRPGKLGDRLVAVIPGSEVASRHQNPPAASRRKATRL